MHLSVIRIFPSFPRRRESRIRTNSVVFGPKFIRIPTLAGMTADLTTPPRILKIDAFNSAHPLILRILIQTIASLPVLVTPSRHD